MVKNLAEHPGKENGDVCEHVPVLFESDE